MSLTEKTNEQYTLTPDSLSSSNYSARVGIHDKSDENTNSRVLKTNKENIFAQQDYAHVIQAYESETNNYAEEDYAKVSHFKDVYSTRNFSERVQEQMAYYPGMQNKTGPTKEEDPLYTNAKKASDTRMDYWNNAMDNPDALMAGMKSRQRDFDYTKIFGSKTSAEDRARNIGKLITQCIPCFDRLLDINGMLPNGDLLEIHLLNIQINLDLLGKLMALFKNPGLYIDICQFLKYLSHLCVSDLIAMIATLSQYLAKLNLEINFNLNFIIQLVGPILSPFLDGLAAWLDKWIQLIIGPMVCVLDHINETIITFQQLKLPFNEVSASASLGKIAAGQGNKNLVSAAPSAGFKSQVFDQSGSMADTDFKPYAYSWSETEYTRFDDQSNYNRPVAPPSPAEEMTASYEEQEDDWNVWAEDKDYITKKEPPMTEEESAANQAKITEAKNRYNERRGYAKSSSGTQWGRNGKTPSESYKSNKSWEAGGYLPPEKQQGKGKPTEYYLSTPMVNSFLQLRNILQAAIAYIQDWFTYITQMIYDLLGIEIAWMSDKTGSTVLKTNIIQMIMFIKAVLEAIAKTDLTCGLDTNMNPDRMKDVVENYLPKYSDNKFKVLDNGDIVMIPPGSVVQDPDQIKKVIKDNKDKSSPSITQPSDSVASPTKPQDEQKVEESAIIIKSCLNNVSSDSLARVRSWISDFEKRGMNV